MSQRPAIARLRRTLRRHASRGWSRVVFARPGESAEGTELVEEGPGAGTPSDDLVDQLLRSAEKAAAEGRVKQTLVIDETRRVRIDARHGSGKVINLDAQRKSKMMAGKKRTLRPDTSEALLRVIGIMNADGSISARSAKKYKQVEHFVQLCRPIWEKVLQKRTASDEDPLRVLDLGCGNAYLGFVLAESLRLAGVPYRLHGVDRREDFIAQCVQRAETLGNDVLSFQSADIADVLPAQTPLAGEPDLVIALHACDTATDDALALAIRSGARAIMAAPCCQHELEQQLRGADNKASAPLPSLLGQPILRREYASTLTDALRVEILQACGYKVDAIEFVGNTHTPKNLMLRAHRRDSGAPTAPDPQRVAAIRKECEALGVRPRLLDLVDAGTPQADPPPTTLMHSA